MKQYTHLMDIFTQLTAQVLKIMATSSTNSIRGKTTRSMSKWPHSIKTCPEVAVGSTVKAAKVLESWIQTRLQAQITPGMKNMKLTDHTKRETEINSMISIQILKSGSKNMPSN